ncbi:MAG TPA: DUF4286 family protein [Gemmatimonadaceae bacterium]|nr:DUF4286 family protein [Gemmatimonadaceae bacterium]
MAGSGVTYEITATVQQDLREEYERYMRTRHIPELLATGAFSGASFVRSSPGRYRIRYEALSRETLDEYLAKYAPELREHFTAKFPEGIELSREEWDVVEQWPAEIGKK